ncbi:MAG: metallophosphoesterase [Luteolibacter sp.]
MLTLFTRNKSSGDAVTIQAHAPEKNRLRSGAVVSDLHLFAHRSDGQRLFEEFEDVSGDVDDLVLNGDTFDFRWSRLPSETATLDAAMNWLDTLLSRRPRRRVHFLLGNHDCVGAFHQRLERFAETHPGLCCYEHRLRLGTCLFLHGDCANRRMDGADLARYRNTWRRDLRRPAVAAAAYQAVDSLGLSQRFHDWYFPPERTVERVAHHLDHVMPGWTRQIGNCYFGHTHRPFRDRIHQGVRFHNTGSAIRGMGFLPLFFGWDPTQARQANQ